MPPIPPMPEETKLPDLPSEEIPAPVLTLDPGDTLDPAGGADLRRELDALLAETSPPEERSAVSPGLAAAAAGVAAGAPAEAAVPPAAAPAPAPAPNPAAAAPGEPEPGRKSRYAPMSSWGIALQIVLMGIPGVGLLLTVIWACGGCRKIVRRNIARAYVILALLGILLTVVLALLLRFCFAEELTQLFEQMVPGYTIRWS